MNPQEIFSIRVRHYQGDGELLSAMEILLSEAEDKDRKLQEQSDAIMKLTEEIRNLQEHLKELQAASLGGTRHHDRQDKPHENGPPGDSEKTG